MAALYQPDPGRNQRTAENLASTACDANSCRSNSEGDSLVLGSSVVRWFASS